MNEITPPNHLTSDEHINRIKSCLEKTRTLLICHLDRSFFVNLLVLARVSEIAFGWACAPTLLKGDYHL